MAEFVYYNAKNGSTGHTSFELYYSYYSHISFEDKANPYSKSRLADELAKELRDQMLICQQNLLYA